MDKHVTISSATTPTYDKLLREAQEIILSNDSKCYKAFRLGSLRGEATQLAIRGVLSLDQYNTYANTVLSLLHLVVGL